MIETTRHLHRANAGGLIGGVCAGLGAYFRIDATLIRIGWMLFTLLGGAGILVYLIAWSIIPDEEGAPHARSATASGRGHRSSSAIDPALAGSNNCYDITLNIIWRYINA